MAPLDPHDHGRLLVAPSSGEVDETANGLHGSHHQRRTLLQCGGQQSDPGTLTYMQVGYLGPLEVYVADGAVHVPGQRLRLLLLRLALAAGRSVSAGGLADAVWGEDLPVDPANALQSLVSRLRRTLGDAHTVEATALGYRLAIEPEDVDAVRFARLVAEGHRLATTDAHVQAVAALDEALTLWRGEPLAEDASPEAEAERVRLDELRLQARRDRAEIHLRTGRPDEAVTALEHLVREDPLREDIVGVLMEALVAAGRPADALASYEKAREALADELGSDPSPALQKRHLELLRGEQTSAIPSTNLRAAVTTFVGRDDDVRAVGARLSTARLVTLLGTGGAGKTRLATEVAAAVLADKHGMPKAPDGVWFAELAPVTDPDDLALALLEAVGARDVTLMDQSAYPPARSARGRLLEALAKSRALLVVDNCEHVVAAAADVVADVLARCPGVRVLATSREPLGTDGEALYPLSPLALPDEGADPDAAQKSPAVRLLLDRALAAGSELELDATTVGAVVQVVRRLDGLPLAIELAAARLRSLSVQEVADRLSDRFRLLTGGRRTAVRRHRTLRAVVEWSWDLITLEEREVADHFTVLGAGATTEAVAAVCPRWRDESEPDLDEVADLLHALVDKSLIVVELSPYATRYRMLETLREYGAERLAEAGTITAARDAHARYYMKLVDRADLGLRTVEQLRSLRILDVERDNILTALGYLCDKGDAESAVNLAVSLTWYWTLRASGQEATRWLRAAMAVPGASSATMYPVAEAMDVMAALGMPGDRDVNATDRRSADELAPELERLSDRHQALPLLIPLILFIAGDRDASMRALTAVLDSSDRWLRAAARTVRLALAENNGELEVIRTDIDAILAEWQELGDHWGLASAFGTRGQLRAVDGDLDGASADNEAALRELKLLGSGDDDLMVNMRLADLRLRVGDVPGARRFLDAMRLEQNPFKDLLTEVLAIQVALADGDEAELRAARSRLIDNIKAQGEPGMMAAHGIAVGLAAVAAVEVHWGELSTAAGHLRDSYRWAVVTEDLPIVSATGMVVAQLAEAQGDPRTAAVLLGATARLRGAPDETQPSVAKLTARLRGLLGAEFDPLFAQGWGLAREEARVRVDPQKITRPPDVTSA